MARKFILSVCSLVLALAAGSANALERPPRLPAQAWLLIDYATGNILAEHNADRPLPPASLTKLMTVYLVFEQLRAGNIALDDAVSVSRTAARTRGSRVALKPGGTVAVEDLIKSMLLRSANNATVLLAEHIAGSEAQFVARMNARARAWELRETNFLNSNGLDEAGHTSSARDLSRIAAALVRDFPEYYRWFSLRDFTFGRRPIRNSNRLLWRDDAVDGMKTGYTRRAGWCLIASAVHEHTRLIATVLGARSKAARTNASQRLLDYGFRNFETHLIYAANDAATEVRVLRGDTTLVPLGLPDNLYLTLPRGTYARLQKQLHVEETLQAPVRLGQRLGSLTLALDGRVFGEYPLVALKDVGSGDVIQRTIDNLQLLVQ